MLHFVRSINMRGRTCDLNASSEMREFGSRSLISQRSRTHVGQRARAQKFGKELNRIKKMNAENKKINIAGGANGDRN